jgi:hypothetical protein
MAPPLSDSASLPIELNPTIGAGIVHLLLLRRPSAVVAAIPLIVVNAINGETRLVRSAHVSQEILEYEPLRTNPSRSIIDEGMVIRVGASLDDALPDFMDARPAVPVRRFLVFGRLNPQAPTRANMPRAECRGVNSLHRPAITQAIPERPRPARALRTTAKGCQGNKPAEPLPRHIIEPGVYAANGCPHLSPQAPAGLNPARA